ncbi:ferrochelatase [Utexia brackfieldae]|uniref:ferrochelatase n=1 Tax=Utexia brackfieldae TaxID=3074108 RepID=UPI00370D6E33
MHKPEKSGVILVNLGTPDEPTSEAVKRYLTEFLLDRHVVDLPKLFWSPLLRWIILPKKAPSSAKNYAKIWTDKGSPLMVYSQRLVTRLASQLPDMNIALAMTYGKPDLKQALYQLRHCQTIKIIPLYPQYSTTTTLAILNKVRGLVNRWSDKPAISYLHDYADHPMYITALVYHIEAAFETQGIPDTLVLSYHGIPMNYIKKRQDEYADRCALTTSLISAALHKKNIHLDIQAAFQSRFGKGEWTKPDTTMVLKALANKGQHHVQVICPGFSVDCIETLEEIAMFNRTQFLTAGGKIFHYIPALNDSEEQVKLMHQIITESELNPL